MSISTLIKTKCPTMPFILKVLNLHVQVGALPPIAKVHSKEAGF